jgi:tetratricopeptide (TPR) repeat protein
MKYFTLTILVAALLFSCSGTKHYTKMAVKQEASGLINEAAESYYNALQRKRSNIDAQIGMKKTGQLVLNQKLGEFSKAKSFGGKKEAVYAFHTARDYKEKIARVGVTLDIADFYNEDYRSVKESYMADLYEEGSELLENQNFTEAEKKFNEIKNLDPNFKDAKELGDVAYLEPLYSAGLRAFENGMYRSAYDSFGKVIARKADYKDAAAKQKESLDKGTYTIALLPYENASGVQGMDAKMSAYTLESLTKIKDPFLRVVDREHMQAILQEQKLQLSGVIDEQTAVQVGQLVGAQAILTGTVLSYDAQNGKLRNTSRTGYESYREKKVNAEGQE